MITKLFSRASLNIASEHPVQWRRPALALQTHISQEGACILSLLFSRGLTGLES